MAISYPLSLPSPRERAELTLELRSAVSVTRDPFGLREQVQAHEGQLWLAQARLPLMKRADAAPWVAFLAKLRGRWGTFLLGDPLATSPQGAGGGTPQVDGAGQTGLTLATKGWPNSTLVLKEGDWLQLGSGSTARLYQVQDDATSDGSGLVTLEIAPRLRESPGDGDGITISSAVGLFRLAEDTVRWTELVGGFWTVEFTAVEAW